MLLSLIYRWGNQNTEQLSVFSSLESDYPNPKTKFLTSMGQEATINTKLHSIYVFKN